MSSFKYTSSRSLADQDSDRWIFEVLAPELRRKMKDLKKDIQWTDLVASTLRDLHAKGGTREDIEASGYGPRSNKPEG